MYRLLLGVVFATAFVSLSSPFAKGADEKLWGKVNGEWEIDLEASAKLPEIPDPSKENLRAAKANGVKLLLTVETGKAKVVITTAEKSETIECKWRVFSEDAKGAFVESITGENGEKKERVLVTYLTDGTMKFMFFDMDYPVIAKRTKDPE